jgi:hypothetical protein
MVRNEKSHASWWQLYLLGVGLIALLVLGALAPISERGHQAAAIGALLLASGLVGVWLRANAPALLRVSRLLLVQRPHLEPTAEIPDRMRQPASVPWWQPPEADVMPQTAAALTRQEHTV